MKLRIHNSICLVAAIAILIPGSAHAVVSWTFNSVKSYGAYGDGLHDDTAAINSAITGGTVSGKMMVYFPPGTYKYTGPMTLAANTSCRIYGDGPGVSTILFTGPNAGINGSNMGEATLDVDGLTLKALSANCGTAITGLFVPSGGRFRTASIHSVQIIGTTRDGTTGGYWSNGIRLYRAENSVIDKVHISGNQNATQTGILWEGINDPGQETPNTSGVQLSNLEIKWCNTALATSGKVEGLYMTGFEFISCGRSGYSAVSLYSVGGGAAFHLANGQVDALGNGITLNGLAFAKISTVYFRHSGSEATHGTMLSVNNLEDLVVSDCTFYGMYSGTFDENGIFLTGVISARIGGNNFSHMQPHNGSCIVISSSSSIVRITDNLFTDVRQRFNDMTADPNDPYYCGNSPTNLCGSNP
jgi:hypothetical protein